MNIRKKLLLIIVLSLSFIVFGVLLLRFQRTNQVVIIPESNSANLSKNSNSIQKLKEAGIPVRVAVSDVGIDVPVQKGFYDPDKKTWTLSLDKAQFAMMSNTPNAVEGNTYIYGHARANVFAPLLKAKPGAVAVVNTENGQEYSYRLKTILVVKPEDSSMLQYHGSPILTLQTCSGSLFQNRSLYIFEFVSSQNV